MSTGGDGSAQRKENSFGDDGETQNAMVIPVNFKSTKSEIFRQTRYSSDFGVLNVCIQSKNYTLKNWSRTGLAFDSSALDANAFTIGDIITDACVFSSGIKVFEGEMRIVSKRTNENEQCTIACSLVSSLFLVEGVQAATAVSECSTEVLTSAVSILSANPEFCRIVLVLNSSLKKFEKACFEEEKRWRNMSYDQKSEAEKVFFPNMSAKIKELFIDLGQKISGLIDVENLPEDSVYHKLVNEQIYPFFERSDIIRRAFEKPRGYAGDYEMMNQIYRSNFEGTDVFGRILHNYITNEKSGESVKFRKSYLHRHIRDQLNKNGEIDVLSIASGPAVEYQEVIRTWTPEDISRLGMTLFDLDREALEHAQARILELATQRGVSPRTNYINASVKSFLGAQSLSSCKYDFIYSAGLFDYLDNRTSATLTKKFYSMLKPKGRLLLGNFTKNNKTKAFLHLLANWSLIHKTKEEIMGWADEITGCRKSIEIDDNDMIAFLVLEKDEVS